jgi:RimJ/RimL family protein N-acetyltransferase
LGRILEAAKNGLLLRRAVETDEDRRTFFEARNDPVARRYSRDREEIEYDGHEKWFSDAIKNPKRHLFIIEFDGKSAGYCRVEGAENEVSIALLPAHRGKHLGYEALLLLTRYFRKKGLKAVIRNDNVASRLTFSRAGFRQTSSDGVWEVWRKT